ncbi:MAG: TIGR04133 family radical SAM/SPASM protein [Fibrobacterales bacterium]
MTTIPLRKKAALTLYRAHKAIAHKQHKLNYLFWECTLRCNINCIHCGSDCTKDSGTADMPKEDFLKAIDSIAPHVEPNKTIIAITGGEPLMRKDLAEVGMELNKRGFPWGMVTNGWAMTPEKFRELLAAGLRSMTISLDGMEHNHDLFRGRKNSFCRAIGTIQMAASVPRLTYDVMTCVNQKNLSELETIKEMLIGFGVKRWRVTCVFPKGRAKEYPFLKLCNSEMQQLVTFIQDTRKEGKILVDYGCEGFFGKYEGEVRNYPFFCRAGVSIGSILVDGSISACPSLRADYIQGNIYNDDFMDVWQNKFQIMRDRSWAKTGKCTDCKSWKYCQGNGLHLRDETSGELLKCHLDDLGLYE